MIVSLSHYAAPSKTNQAKTYLAQEGNDPVSTSDGRNHDLVDSFPLRTSVQML